MVVYRVTQPNRCVRSLNVLLTDVLPGLTRTESFLLLAHRDDRGDTEQDGGNNERDSEGVNGTCPRTVLVGQDGHKRRLTRRVIRTHCPRDEGSNETGERRTGTKCHGTTSGSSDFRHRCAVGEGSAARETESCTWLTLFTTFHAKRHKNFPHALKSIVRQY